MEETEPKVVPCDEAPSGAIVFYRYKAPFTPFQGGYGDMGSLIYDFGSGKLRCHLCGEWFEQLHWHLEAFHAMTGEEYREKVSLEPNTPLISMKQREKLSEAHRLAGSHHRLPKHQMGVEHSVTTRMQMSVSARKTKNTVEFRNKKATCDAQLIARVKAICDDLGRTAKNTECTFLKSVNKHLGSWNNAIKLAGYEPNTPGSKVNKLSKEDLMEELEGFYDAYGRDPVPSDIDRGLLPGYRAWKREWGGIRPAIDEMMARRSNAAGERVSVAPVPTEELQKPDETPYGRRIISKAEPIRRYICNDCSTLFKSRNPPGKVVCPTKSFHTLSELL